ncbi:M48 family metalloprotease [Ruegeria sp. 2205SS24-7]|uniref:M48 family metalloprotease n=1 Tax=Ruegeria discodermiae TaxID=3064389 RepID=UPI0027406D19|nr:M48 family metalloprotease [Ruegeria sp. 2205SS24-7]MDP5215988.1 M48 family metalloprotease [Ruegeria sp. 2205SS24-7]
MPISHVAAMAFDRVSRLASIPALALSCLLLLLSAIQAGAVGLLRDADIENGLRELSFPILRAAGLNPRRVKVLLVNDDSFNAFVVDNNAIYINYGLILQVETPEMLQAVIAHEAAHIANGHIARRLGNIQSAQTASALGFLLGLAVAAAGSPEAGGGIAAGTQTSALRSFLKHTRAEESAADRSAVSFLRAAGISPRGMVQLHRKFVGQETLSESLQDPYMRSHPMNRDRMRAAESYVAAFGDGAEPNENADYWFARVKGKLSAFMRSPKWTMRRAQSEPYADIRAMREAAAYHRSQNLSQARAAIDRALSLKPDDPYYLELKGQILMENRRTSEAMQTYAAAAEIAPTEPLILAGYGRALLALDRPKEALPVLERARTRDFRDARMMRDLAVAYSKLGQTGMASLVTAERYALNGRMEDAGLHAQRAVAQLSTGSPGWQRAEDVLLAAKRAEKKRRKR